jgi:hypothetical protein
MGKPADVKMTDKKERDFKVSKPLVSCSLSVQDAVDLKGAMRCWFKNWGLSKFRRLEGTLSKTNQ